MSTPKQWPVVYSTGRTKNEAVATYLTKPTLGVGEVVRLSHEYMGYRDWKVINCIDGDWWLMPAAAPSAAPGVEE